MATAASTGPGGLPFPEYFTAMATSYAKQTGDSTRSAFAQSWDDITAALPIKESSVVHDNASGPGTATCVIASQLCTDSLPQILATDSVPAMVDAARESFRTFSKVTTRELDSQDLKDIPDLHFTHSILNFSIFTFPDPLAAVREIHRTLQYGGLAALLTWKRFGAGEVIRASQARVRPDLPPMRFPHPEFLEEGVLENLVAEAGFSKDGIKVLQKTVAIGGGEELAGLRGFLKGDLTKGAREGFTEEEEAKWAAAVDETIEDEIKKYGGVKFEAWVVLAKK